MLCSFLYSTIQGWSTYLLLPTRLLRTENKPCICHQRVRDTDTGNGIQKITEPECNLSVYRFSACDNNCLDCFLIDYSQVESLQLACPQGAEQVIRSSLTTLTIEHLSQEWLSSTNKVIVRKHLMINTLNHIISACTSYNQALYINYTHRLNCTLF